MPEIDQAQEAERHHPLGFIATRPVAITILFTPPPTLEAGQVERGIYSVQQPHSSLQARVDCVNKSIVVGIDVKIAEER